MIGWIVLALVILAIVASVAIYNRLVNYRNDAKNAFAQIDVQLTRRYDLIPNLVNTVKGYAAHEQATLTAVIEARAKATQITVDPNHLDEAALKRFSAAQGELSSALGRLMAVSESYPELKANENFLMLQSQLEGTENRIAVERKRFNELVNVYNGYIRHFPNNFFAQAFGFQRRAYFEADKESEKAPNVSF